MEHLDHDKACSPGFEFCFFNDLIFHWLILVVNVTNCEQTCYFPFDTPLTGEGADCSRAASFSWYFFSLNLKSRGYLYFLQVDTIYVWSVRFREGASYHLAGWLKAIDLLGGHTNNPSLNIYSLFSSQ